MNQKRVRFSEMMVLIVFGVLLLVNAGAALADIKLPAVISDNMVLQRNKKVSIWGWADPGEEVMVSVSWHRMRWAVTAGDNGKWMFKMNSPKMGGPYEMTISGKNTITLKNIMVGEVWVCSGQSNMQMSVKSSANAEQEIAAADYPDIRLFTVERKVAEQPQSDCVGNWTLCSPQTVPDFSAAAYYFGRELQKELDVPIGLIHTSWGGTPAEAWTRRGILKEESDFAPILERYDDAVAKYPQAMEEYEQKVEEWKKAAEKDKAEGERTARRPNAPFGPGHYQSPSGLYNAMIAPLIPYGIGGAIWYQGESNAGRAYQYRKLFPAMIQNWRKDWGQSKFPFLFVQLANFMAVKPEPADSAWAELREAQLMTLALPNTGMAVIIDIGDANDIHPKNKQGVGKRLALWALARSYGKELVYSGPIYKSMEIEGEKIILHFDHVGGGLVAGSDGPLKGFGIAGADRKFVWADAKIDGDSVVVSSDEVSTPVAVRYAWADNPVCNLYNEEGLPASPFRTDDWPGITVDKK
ncbi:MAG TPA: sialate O-acetylesterase [Sedimentisphaerales bacterium]|nr:sialate O-acetylesterase [Sedimentisphaerales bacterium]